MLQVVQRVVVHHLLERAGLNADEDRPTLWKVLKESDMTYSVNTERPFQARNAKAYEVEILYFENYGGVKDLQMKWEKHIGTHKFVYLWSYCCQTSCTLKFRRKMQVLPSSCSSASDISQ